MRRLREGEFNYHCCLACGIAFIAEDGEHVCTEIQRLKNIKAIKPKNPRGPRVQIRTLFAPLISIETDDAEKNK